MRGLSLMIYTILLLLIYFVESSAFLTMAGGMKGVSLQISQTLDKVHTDLSQGEQLVVPKGMETFITDCDFPIHSELSDEEIDAALEGCRHPYEGDQNWPGLVCLFYDFHGHEYRMCKELVYEPTRTWYFSGDESPLYLVSRDNEEGTLTLSKP